MMIKGDPYDYPFNQDLRPTNTALIVIDMQFDFCGEGATSIRWAMISRSPARPSSPCTEP